MRRSTGRPPKYPEVADQLRDRIYAGDYRSAGRLPNYAALAVEYGIGTTTMRRALSLLKEEGLIRSTGSGMLLTHVPEMIQDDKPCPRKILASFGVPEDIVTDALDLHAHQLAEKQRAWLKFQGYDSTCACGSCSACLAQDYIAVIDPLMEA